MPASHSDPPPSAAELSHSVAHFYGGSSPSSTKNAAQARDPEMCQTKKGNLKWTPR